MEIQDQFSIFSFFHTLPNLAKRRSPETPQLVALVALSTLVHCRPPPPPPTCSPTEKSIVYRGIALWPARPWLLIIIIARIWPLLLTLRHPCFASPSPSPPLPFLFEVFPYFQGPFYDDTLKVSTHSLPTFALTLAICCYENHVRYVTIPLFSDYLEDKILDWNPREPNLLSEVSKKRNKRKEEGQEERKTQEPVITRIFINL